MYAIEQKATAQQLLRRNLEKFHLANVIPVDGKAPEILESLEPPTHVFIGGSSGRLADILHVIWEKNPRTRVVVNARNHTGAGQQSKNRGNLSSDAG